MNKALHISAAALLLFAVSCNPLSIDSRYDISKLDKTVTVLPGVTVQYEQELLNMQIGELIGETGGDNSFFRVASGDDPYFDEGDLYFIQEGKQKSISPDVDALYDGSSAIFKNPLTIYLADVPGALNVSNEYHLSNPCIALEITTDWLQAMQMDVTMNIGGKQLTAANIPLAATASQTVYISELGGYADKEATSSDFILDGLADAISPLPYNITVTEVKLRGKGSPALIPGTPVNISLKGALIIPAAFNSPSEFGVDIAFNGVRIIPTDDQFRVGIYSISAHLEVVNTTPVAISITSLPNDNVRLRVPTIKPGSLEAPATTEGDITLEYSDYDSIRQLVTEISAKISGTKAKLNNKQGLKITLKSVTLPDGVEIEILDNNYGGNEQ